MKTSQNLNLEQKELLELVKQDVNAIKTIKKEDHFLELAFEVINQKPSLMNCLSKTILTMEY